MFKITNDIELERHLKPGEITVLKTGYTTVVLSLLARLTEEKKRAVYISMDLTQIRFIVNTLNSQLMNPQLL